VNGLGKNFFIVVLIFLFVIMVFSSVIDNGNANDTPFSDFLKQVDAGEIEQATIQGKDIQYVTSSKTSGQTFAPDYPNIIERLEAGGVRVDAKRPDQSTGFIYGLIQNIIFIALIVVAWLFIMNKVQGGGGGGGGGGGAMGFGKSRAKLMTERQGSITFDDVAGIDEASEELSEIVDFLKDPGKFQSLGGKIPKGVLLTGSPGTGKTLLARAIAGEAQVPFFSISGSDFVEMFVGVGASRVRDMFEQGRKNAPCIIFIDEIDAVGRHRGAGVGGGNDEREQTLNQMLVEMDGFDAQEGVIIIAATNRPDVLDKALLRPGRFDRQIPIPLPDMKGRAKILKIHAKNVPTAPDVDMKIIARGTPGFAGADLANLVNEAALLAARRDKKIVTMRELEDAKDKVMMGAERRSMAMSDNEKELTAYHEAGHAIVGILMPACDPIHKATIIPRGRALGMVMRLPEEDRLSYSREKMTSDIAMGLGGRMAEELIFGAEKVTSGASSDIKYVTSIAKSMVAHWGFSSKVGNMYYNNYDEQSGMEVMISQDKANLLDEEARILIEDGDKAARKILTERLDDLHNVAKALIEYETLNGNEINDIMAGKKIRQNENKDEKKKSRSSAPKAGIKDDVPAKAENTLAEKAEEKKKAPAKKRTSVPKTAAKKKDEESKKD
jgi:cell division protease FtsH